MEENTTYQVEFWPGIYDISGTQRKALGLVRRGSRYYSAVLESREDAEFLVTLIVSTTGMSRRLLDIVTTTKEHQ